MTSNGFSTLRSLLSSEPRVSPLLLETNNNNCCHSQQNITSPSKPLNQKEKKKAAFDNWHKRKLDELRRKCSADSSSEPDNSNDYGGSVAPCESPAAVTEKVLESPGGESLPLSQQQQNQSSISLIQQLVQANTTVPAADFSTALFPNTRPIAANRSNTTVHQSNNGALGTAVGKDLTSPKLSRHNDAAFYPNIQCILCKEWVCSRNRYMHIESHLQYRPYKCSLCNYDNRKKIFIELHINRVHKGVSTVVYHPDPELEKRAWVMAEQCLQHTREVLLNGDAPASKEKQIKAREPKIQQQTTACNNRAILDKSILAPYEDVYRPKIFNSQRNEKSQLIEESRQLGLVPDFSEVANREERCELCNSYILRIPGLLEEHVRSHVSQPTYQCSFDDCTIRHCSRNFLFRHMKEVHKTRKNVKDLIHTIPQLVEEFALLCQICFPAFYRSEANVLKRKLQTDAINKTKKLKADHSSSINTGITTDCLGCRVNMNLNQSETSCAECCLSKTKPKGRLFCSYCARFVPGDFTHAQMHALEHLPLEAAFSCNFCSFSTNSSRLAKSHATDEHSDQSSSSSTTPTTTTTTGNTFDFDWSKKLDWRDTWWTTMSNCFDKDNQIRTNNSLRIFELSCRLCCSSVKGDYRALLDHTLKHLSCPRFACLYCDFENGSETEIQVHLRLQHAKMAVVIRIDATRGCMEERDRLLTLCFPEAGCPPWTTTATQPVGQQSQQETDTSLKILCKLCQHTLTLDESECLHHVQRHVVDPIFQCHFCVYKDVDSSRMKMHTEHLHNSSSYSKLMLPSDLSIKFAQIMAFCF